MFVSNRSWEPRQTLVRETAKTSRSETVLETLANIKGNALSGKTGLSDFQNRDNVPPVTCAGQDLLSLSKKVATA
jgi:hypothetical protein